MTRPVRIQLSRKKGFRLQEASLAVNGLACVKVDRSTRWGNLFVRGVGGVKSNDDAVHLYRCMLAGYLPICAGPSFEEMRAARRYVNGQLWRLRGKNLACWCRGEPCHATVLLEIANGGEP